MSVDIRKYTRVIIRKNNEYLIGKDGVRDVLKWGDSPWDAWWTRDAEEARAVAKRTGGVAMLFNPVIGKVVIL